MTVDSQTKISLFAALGGLPLLIGGIAWLTAIDARANSAETIALRNEVVIEKQINLLLEMRDRLVRIEEQLKRR
jgi:hypothetical protein